MTGNAEAMEQVMNNPNSECLRAQRVPDITTHWIAQQNIMKLFIRLKSQILIYPC